MNAEDNKFNFVENETFYGENLDVNQSFAPERNMTDALRRKIKFDKPPKSVN